jgi:hypothetical protein
LGWNPPYDPAPPDSLLLPAWPSQSAQSLALAHPTPSLIPPSQCQHDPMSTPHHVVPTCYLWSNSATRASSTQHKITPLSHFPHHLLVINESNGRINPRNGNYESSHSFLNPDLIWSRDQLCSFPDSLAFKRSPCSHCFTLFLPRIHKAPPIAALPQRHLRLIELPSRSRMTRYPRMTMNPRAGEPLCQPPAITKPIWNPCRCTHFSTDHSLFLVPLLRTACFVDHVGEERIEFGAP